MERYSLTMFLPLLSVGSYGSLQPGARVRTPPNKSISATQTGNFTLTKHLLHLTQHIHDVRNVVALAQANDAKAEAEKPFLRIANQGAKDRHSIVQDP